MSDRDWRDQAACRDSDPELFDYDPDTDPTSKADAAKQACAGCAVRDACLGFALSQPADQDLVGVYGGLTPQERDARRRTRAPQRGVISDRAFAAAAFEFATAVGVARAAGQLGLTNRTLQRAWRRHGFPPFDSTKPAGVEAPLLRQRVARRLEELGYTGVYQRPDDPEFAASSFGLARTIGISPAAVRLHVSATTLLRAWEQHGLGRPQRPPRWTQRFAADRELVEQAFHHARESSILAAASQFQVTAPTLRRAFARHGLGHPHHGLDRGELRRRWSDQAGADHRNRQQRRDYRARRAAQRATARAAAAHQATHAARPRPARARAVDDALEERAR